MVPNESDPNESDPNVFEGAVLGKPTFTVSDAEEMAGQSFGLFGRATLLTGERDQNFLIETPGDKFVLKITSPAVKLPLIEFENQALRIAEAIDDFESPRLIKSFDNQTNVSVGDEGQFIARCISYVPGRPLAEFKPHSADLLAELGRCLALLDNSLESLNQNVAAKRELYWDLAKAPEIVRNTLELIEPTNRKRQLQKLLSYFDDAQNQIAKLPQGVIHNDANDYNWMIHVEDGSDVATVGLIDFGDAVYSTKLNDLAICAAYLMLGKENPIQALCAVARGYHEVRELGDAELAALFPLACMRLAQSVSIAARQKKLRPDDQYLTITEQPAWKTIEKLVTLDLRDVVGELESVRTAQLSASLSVKDKLLERRRKHISPSLSLSYDKPLHILQGKGQYLYDENGLMYLDCVNNVCHVGHCHPHVVEAISAQAKTLNTNTRYLHENILRLSERLVAKLPNPLEVCFFVNSGSEANDLALRLAAAKTGRRDIIALDHAYHGHVTSLIEISAYKFNRTGGKGQPEHLHLLPMPDSFRGKFRREEFQPSQYVEHAINSIVHAIENGKRFCAFIAESILSCGGQIPLPSGYLKSIYDCVREHGGVVIADEVQVGFGRVGEKFWGFELQDVTPDIVTMGKPFGNGHPLAAVVTTREIAEAFDNGMEYFNTFGGNPVSCAAGLAVLDVIENEKLQENALQLGTSLLADMKELATKYPGRLGDVRGYGFFLGLEFVADNESRTPDPELASRVKQDLFRRKILLSTDGPDENVIKFKPPMVFDEANAGRLISCLDDALAKLA